MRTIDQLRRIQWLNRTYGDGAATLFMQIEQIILNRACCGEGFVIRVFSGPYARLLLSDFVTYLAQETGCTFDIRPGHDDSTVRVLIDLPEGE